PYDTSIIGIYSEKPGFRLSQIGEKIAGEKAIPVALTGRVPVKVSTENGAIRKGDFLTSSSIPGVAMKATQPGQVIGKAMEDFNGNGVGKVMTFVNLSFADPENVIGNLTTNQELSSVSSTNVKLPDDLVLNGTEVHGSLTEGLLALNSGLTDANNSINGLQSAVAQLQTKTTTLETQLSDLQSLQASTAAALAQTNALANQAIASNSALTTQVATNNTQLASLSASLQTVLANIASTASGSATVQPVSNISSPTILLASASADLENVNMMSTATISADMISDNVTVTDTFKSFGKSYLGDTTISGNVLVNGDTMLGNTSITKATIEDRLVVGTTLSVAKDSINVIGSPVAKDETPSDGILYLQKSSLANGLDIFDGKVTINAKGDIITKGNISVKGNINVEGAITITATAGEAIKAKDALYIAQPEIVKKADALDSTKVAVVGIAANDAAKGDIVTIIIGGKATGFKNLHAGKRYFLSTDGTITDVLPSSIKEAIPVGVAFSDTQLLMQLSPITQAVAGASTVDSQ
ncbi:MAG TPA: hypothetical protein VHD33_05170, partial [Legionellaceae bacterium]|nr:hypothetical protein [Legionellaceae bacterium]